MNEYTEGIVGILLVQFIIMCNCAAIDHLMFKQRTFITLLKSCSVFDAKLGKETKSVTVSFLLFAIFKIQNNAGHANKIIKIRDSYEPKKTSKRTKNNKKYLGFSTN